MDKSIKENERTKVVVQARGVKCVKKAKNRLGLLSSFISLPLLFLLLLLSSFFFILHSSFFTPLLRRTRRRSRKKKDGERGSFCIFAFLLFVYLMLIALLFVFPSFFLFLFGLLLYTWTPSLKKRVLPMLTSPPRPAWKMSRRTNITYNTIQYK